MEFKIKYGDIILIDFNPIRGSEISKIRPCVVVSRNVLNSKSPLLVVVPLTSNVERMLSFHLLIKKTKNNGLSQFSKALPEQIKSVDKIRFVKELGKLEIGLLKKLEQKIAYVLNQT